MISYRRRESNQNAKEASTIQRDKLWRKLESICNINAVALQRKRSKRNVCATFLQYLLGLAEAHVFAHGKRSSKLHFATVKAF